MLRLMITDERGNNQYEWCNDRRTAHLIAFSLVKNGDACEVKVENLREKKVEKIYKKS